MIIIVIIIIVIVVIPPKNLKAYDSWNHQHYAGQYNIGFMELTKKVMSTLFRIPPSGFEENHLYCFVELCFSRAESLPFPVINSVNT